MEEQLTSHLVNLCNAVGGYELDFESGKETYVVGVEALECMRDIKRILRHDDKTSDKMVLRALGDWNFLAQDLLPILKLHQNDQKLVEASLELIVPLTFPVDHTLPYAASQNVHVRNHTEAIVGSGALEVLFQLLIGPLSIPHVDRSARDIVNIRLLLTLCRNIVRAGTDTQDPHDKLQSMVFEGLNSSHLLEFFVTLSSCIDEAGNSEWKPIALDIFHSLFCKYSPRMLLDVDKEEEFESVLKKQKISGAIASITNTSRHPRFGGSLVVNVGATSRYVYPSSKGIDMGRVPDLLDNHAAKSRKRQNRKAKETDNNTMVIQHRLPQNCREILCNVVQMFLESGFNVMMKSLKDDLQREREYIGPEEYQYFSTLLSFCLEFICLLQSDPDCKLDLSHVASLLDIHTIGFFLKRIMQNYEDKVVKNVMLDIKAFTQLIKSIGLLSQSTNEDHKHIADHLQRNLFYREEYLKFLQKIVAYPLALTTDFMSALVEMTHHILRMMERYLKVNEKLYVQRRTRGAHERANDSDEEEGHDAAFKEMKFEMYKFEYGYANEATMAIYFGLLRNVKSLSDETIHFITKMLHRMFVKCEAEALFYKMEYINIMNDVLKERTSLILYSRECKDLIQFIRFLTGRLLKKLREYPPLFVELLCAKPRVVWRKIQYGDAYNATAFRKNLEKKHRKQSGDGSPPRRRRRKHRMDEDSDMEEDAVPLRIDPSKLSAAVVDDSSDDEDELVYFYRKRMEQIGGIPTLPNDVVPRVPAVTAPRSAPTVVSRPAVTTELENSSSNSDEDIIESEEDESAAADSRISAAVISDSSDEDEPMEPLPVTPLQESENNQAMDEGEERDASAIAKGRGLRIDDDSEDDEMSTENYQEIQIPISRSILNDSKFAENPVVSAALLTYDDDDDLDDVPVVFQKSSAAPSKLLSSAADNSDEENHGNAMKNVSIDG
eukprot:Partr_v1_DN28294_c0_g1_i2_m75402 putative Forms a fork protection complex (FPC) with csm-3 and which is required for chromosome segregation during meiosis and DNA damage repair. FPC coordinates leading and lagging strand synthesis and moves with the replication fork. FPC stabilizes replication forks in a configuration that is recognized by replication checkpoint sensors